jgi:hypothetical protein
LHGTHLSGFAAKTRRYPPFSFCSKNQKVPTFQFLQQKPGGTHLSVFAAGTHLSVFAAKTRRYPPFSFCMVPIFQFLQQVPTFQFLWQKPEGTHLSVFAWYPPTFQFCCSTCSVMPRVSMRTHASKLYFVLPSLWTTNCRTPDPVILMLQTATKANNIKKL